MRNFVAKNDFNRSPVHPDLKKAWEPDIDEGLDEHYDDLEEEEDEDFDPQKIAISEYERGVKDSGIL